MSDVPFVGSQRPQWYECRDTGLHSAGRKQSEVDDGGVMVRQHRTQECLFLATLFFPLLGACNSELDTRLTQSIKNWEETSSDLPLDVARRNAVLGGLKKLSPSELGKPRVLFAACLPMRDKGAFAFCLNYADRERRAAFFRVYGRGVASVELVEQDSSRAYDEPAAATRVDYEVVFAFDAGSAPAFGTADEVYVEVHNRDGTTSPPYRVQMLGFGGVPRGAATEPASRPEGGL